MIFSETICWTVYGTRDDFLSLKHCIDVFVLSVELSGFSLQHLFANSRNKIHEFEKKRKNYYPSMKMSHIKLERNFCIFKAHFTHKKPKSYYWFDVKEIKIKYV